MPRTLGKSHIGIILGAVGIIHYGYTGMVAVVDGDSNDIPAPPIGSIMTVTGDTGLIVDNNTDQIISRPHYVSAGYIDQPVDQSEGSDTD